MKVHVDGVVLGPLPRFFGMCDDHGEKIRQAARVCTRVAAGRAGGDRGSLMDD